MSKVRLGLCHGGDASEGVRAKAWRGCEQRCEIVSVHGGEAFKVTLGLSTVGMRAR